MKQLESCKEIPSVFFGNINYNISAANGARISIKNDISNKKHNVACGFTR
jgi:hypothetical protein